MCCRPDRARRPSSRSRSPRHRSRSGKSSSAPGDHELAWRPDPRLAARTYILRVTATPLAGTAHPAAARAVVRILGVDAGFGVRSARPGDTATLVVRTDAAHLSLQMLHSGPETQPTYANGLIQGIPVGTAQAIDWRAHRDHPAPVPVQIGADWPSGVYAAQLTADDGRVGFAPIIVRPAAPQHRVAVVIPTTSWQAYNFYDANNDGWGDTWYAHWKTEPHRHDASACRSRRAVSLPQLRPQLPALARANRETGRRLRRRGHRAVLDAGCPAGGLRPARVPGSHRVRDVRPLRPRRGLSRSWREPHVPGREQLLPARRQARFPCHVDRRVARPRPSRGGAPRRAIRRERPRRTACAVHRRRCRHCLLGLRGHRSRERRAVRPLRDRDRRALAGFAARACRCLRRSPTSSGRGARRR